MYFRQFRFFLCESAGVFSFFQWQKHRNTKYFYAKLRNICSKLRNNHENSKILQKNNQKSWKINKIIINNKNDENKIFQKTWKNSFHQLYYFFMIFVTFSAIIHCFHDYFATWSKYFATWDLFRASGGLPGFGWREGRADPTQEKWTAIPNLDFMQ